MSGRPRRLGAGSGIDGTCGTGRRGETGPLRGMGCVGRLGGGGGEKGSARRRKREEGRTRSPSVGGARGAGRRGAGGPGRRRLSTRPCACVRAAPARAAGDWGVAAPISSQTSLEGDTAQDSNLRAPRGIPRRGRHDGLGQAKILACKGLP